MSQNRTIWTTPSEFLRSRQPDQPVLFFSPAALQNNAALFLREFPGLVTFAVKSNPCEAVLANLVAAGISAFDVASPAEIDLVRRCAPHAALHYNNPVRSCAEIRFAHHAGVRSFSVDSFSELEKLYQLVPAQGVEVAVRFKLPVKGAAYDFGDKFGADPQTAATLLARSHALGFVASLTFHPGTQCNDPMAWDAYIRMAGEIATRAGVRIFRLNVGGGFASHRLGDEMPDLARIFAVIGRVTGAVFGETSPALLC
ncbi:MAG: type III PLP-dependent enzyme, partial [Paracoccaceae bacterium]